MADGEVLVAVNLQVEQAEKQAEALAKKIAKTKVDLSINTAELDKVKAEYEAWLDTQGKALDLLSNIAKPNRFGAWVAKNGYSQDLVNRVASQYEQASASVNTYGKEVERLTNEQNALNDTIDETVYKLETVNAFIANVKPTAFGSFAQVNETVMEQGMASVRELLQPLETFGDTLDANIEKIKEAGGAVGSFGKRILRLAKNVMVFSVVTSALRGVRSAFTSLLTADEALNKSLQQLKGNLLTLVTPLINLLLPAFRTLVSVLSLLIQQIGTLVFSLFGINWGDAQKSAKDMSKSFGASAGSAKEIQKSLAGIDEINRLDSGSAGGGGAGAGGGAGLSFDTQQITDKLLEIEAIALGATLALGVLLTMSGNPKLLPLGLGLIAVGAVGLASEMATNWNSVAGKTRTTIATIMGIASGALLALGTIMVITGHLGMGIPMIIAGLAGTISSIAFDWNSTTERLRNVIATVLGIVSGAMLVVGALFLFTGANVGLGLALMAGAIGVSAIPFNFNWITNTVRNVIDTLKTWLNAFIGLLKAWWDKIKADFSNGIDNMKTKIQSIKQKFTDTWQSIKDWFNTSVKPKLTAEYWAGVFSTIKDGAKSAVNTALNAVFELINKAIYWINERLNFKWQSIKIAGVEVLPSGSKQIAKIKEIPMLAQGTVVPPNRQFMAMLGDNKTETEVVSPLSTMKEALAEALAESNQHITVNIDGRQLFDIIVGQNNAEVRRTGQTPLMV